MSLQRNFILQQGFTDPSADSCSMRYAALQFQPRMVGLILLTGVLFQSSQVFLVLAMLLYFSAMVPRWNPFEAIYNRFWARSSGAMHLLPARAPRRFAQAMAATFSFSIAVCLHAHSLRAAYVLEGFLGAAVAALIFGGFCLGSFTYLLIKGQFAFAIATLPWTKTPK